MREYIFRGKRKDDGEWVEGGLIPLDVESGYVFIAKPYLSASTLPVYEIIKHYTHLVDPETVGQYTGHICKNGKLFEGDIIKYKDSPPNLIRWNQDISGFEAVLVCDGVEYTCVICKVEDVEIIGNIHDNPELLKEGGGE